MVVVFVVHASKRDVFTPWSFRTPFFYRWSHSELLQSNSFLQTKKLDILQQYEVIAGTTCVSGWLEVPLSASSRPSTYATPVHQWLLESHWKHPCAYFTLYLPTLTSSGGLWLIQGEGGCCSNNKEGYHTLALKPTQRTIDLSSIL